MTGAGEWRVVAFDVRYPERSQEIRRWGFYRDAEKDARAESVARRQHVGVLFQDHCHVAFVNGGIVHDGDEWVNFLDRVWTPFQLAAAHK